MCLLLEGFMTNLFFYYSAVSSQQHKFMSVNNYALVVSPVLCFLIRVSFSYDFLEQQKNYVQAKYNNFKGLAVISTFYFCAHYKSKADVTHLITTFTSKPLLTHFIVFLQNVVNRNAQGDWQRVNNKR